MKNKFKFFLSALLVLLFGTLSSTCLGANLTLNEFREICNIPADVTIPSNVQTSITTQNPVIIKSKDGNFIHIYPITSIYNTFSDEYNKITSWGFNTVGSGASTQYIFSPNYDYANGSYVNGSSIYSAQCHLYDVKNQTFTNQTWIYIQKGYSIDKNQVGARIGFQIDLNNQTETDFKSLSNLKSFLMDNLLFSGQNSLVYGGQNVLYRFNGVYAGDDVYTSKFTTNLNNFRFTYEAYSSSENYSVVNYYYLQKFAPNEAIQLTNKDIAYWAGENWFYDRDRTEDFSFNTLIDKMEPGYIYRLRAFSNQHNASGDLVRTSDATSQFFSLNSWKSSEIEVLNIYELLFTDNPSIEDTGGGPSGGGVIDITDITNSQVDANKDYWGEDLDQSDFENQISDSLNGIMDNISGEFSRNQIFESLQGAENGFLNFFKNQQGEQFYDLQFSWPDINYMGGVLIPAGGFNISQMCRDIPELGRLQTLIRVIFNFGTAVCLIKQIYNLILSTLGIDNPYLYEDYTEVTTINEDGEYRQSAVKRKKKL